MTSNLLLFPQERLLLLQTGFGALLLILLLLLILPDFFAGSVPEADSVGPLPATSGNLIAFTIRSTRLLCSTQ